MRIYKPRGITKSQIVLVTVLGVFSGVYIWQPLFVDFFRVQKEIKNSLNNKKADVPEDK